MIAQDAMKVLHCLALAAVMAAWGAGPSPAEIIGKEDRRTLSSFRKQENLSAHEFAARYGAAARILCRWGRQTIWGSAAIVDRRDVFVTADHVFFNDRFRKFGAETACYVQTLIDGRRYRIKPGSVVHGYVVHETGAPGFENDWAVGRLATPAAIAQPFAVEESADSSKAGVAVTLITQGHQGWGERRPSAGRCTILAQELPLVATDCDAARGASGGPLLVAGPAGEARPRIAAVVVAVADVDKERRRTYGDLPKVSIAVVMQGELARAVLGMRPPLPRAKPAALAELGRWSQRLAADAGDAEALAGRGRALLALGRIEEGLASLEAAVELRKALPLEAVEAALVALDEAFADVARHPEVMLLRARLFARAGDARRRDLEYARYVRLRQDGVPPLFPRQWRGLIEMWQQPRFGDFKAFAVGSDRDRFYRGSGYLWVRTAGEDVVAKCLGNGDERCRLYALGEEVVWGLDYQGLERVFAAYEAALRQREKAAIADLTRAIKEGEAEALAERGDRRLSLGDYPGALADYETLIALRPESAGGWLKRASLYYRLERYDLALADFRAAAERAVGVERNDAVLWGAHAELFTGRREAALAAFETLIEYGSRDVKDAGRLGRGLARLLGGDVAGGLDDFRTIVGRNPTSAVVMEVVCRHLLLAALPAAALPYCEAANLLAAGDPRTLDARAFAYWQSGRRREAEWDLAKAARIDPFAPGPLLRQEQFRILLAKLFLWRQGYDVGVIDSVLDDRARQAIAAYRLANGLAPSAEADDEFLGHLTPLGLGSYRVEAVGLVLPAYRIAAACQGAAEGELAVIVDAKGTRYRCNADGSSVRRLPLATQ